MQLDDKKERKEKKKEWGNGSKRFIDEVVLKKHLNCEAMFSR